MTILPIRTDLDLAAALSRVEEIFDAAPGTPEYEELDVLASLIEHYEDRHYPIAPPDPISAIEFGLEQQGKTRADFAKLFGPNSRSRASEILNRKRPLTLANIPMISRALRIPAGVLVAEYEVG